MGIPNAVDATFPIQAAPDARDFDVITLAFQGYAVASGCACTPASSGSTLGVAVASGSVFVGSKTAVAVTGATVTPGAASGTNPRIDLVVVDNTGALSVVAGAAAAVPAMPAIPASRTVLAAVYIPTSATSITAGNLIDKRILADYVPPLGVTSTTAAAGNHLHSGEYSSTLHGDTHSGTGSDPITSLSGVALANVTLSPTDGTGVIYMHGQTATPPAPVDDGYVALYARWLSYRPIPTLLSLDREVNFGTLAGGPASLWIVYPNTGTTLATSMLGTWAPTTIAGTSTPTVSHPAPTAALGPRTRFATAATANSDWAVSTTDVRWVRGDSVLPWCGYFFHARVAFTDASYNASGATTGSRFFCGLTDIAATGTTSALSADDPATNNRHGFQRINVNGGKTQTNFFMTIKNGTTESLVDSTIALVQNHVYDFFVFIRPNGGYAFGEVKDLTAGTSSGSLLDIPGSSSVPTATTYMRAMVGMKTVNATARTVDVLRVGCEVSA